MVVSCAMRASAISMFCVALFACGDNRAVPPDAAKPDSPPPFAEATHAHVPVVMSGGGAVLSAPVVQPVFFSTDDPATQAQVEQFLGQLGPSSYWRATTSEYGVGAISNLPTIVTTDAPPTTQNDMATWLEGKLDGTHTAEGWPAAPDAQTIYTVFLPQGATYEGACTQYLAYHDEAGMTVPFSYALIPRCSYNTQFGSPEPLIDTVTTGLSHELIEAVTDPLPFSAPAYTRIDPEHYVWGRTPGAELGDMCEYVETAEQRLVGGFAVQRTWSNDSAAAGHDPCVPAMATPYLAAAPVLDEDITITTHSNMIMTKGISVPLNTSKTIEVDLFSDAPTDTDFQVVAYDTAGLFGGSPSLSFQWVTGSTGHNGDKLQLMVTRTKMATNRGSELMLGVKDGGSITSMWWGYVGN
jgi:hypothetical protein